MATVSLKIISGGQTGADRGALDAALASDVPCGGWCPAERLDENGRIPDRYPLTELPEGGFRERTIRNVQDSDGTVVLYFSTVHGGTETTVVACVQHGKPYKLIDCSMIAPDSAVELTVTFLRNHGIRTLNVAGPRASEHPEAYEWAFRLVQRLIRKLTDAEAA